MYLPEWLYRMLPLAYVLAGVAVAAKMDSALAMVSGGLLVIAGVLIWKLRADYRREVPAITARVKVKPRPR